MLVLIGLWRSGAAAASSPELRRFGCRNRCRFHQADLADAPIGIAEHHIPPLAAGEVVVAPIAGAVGIGLRRSDVAAVGLLPVGLFVVHPPVGGH